MGCDIHISTEIRRNGKWQQVPEIPEALDSRDYSVFAALAGVRDSFNGCVFKAKGLPKDIAGMKANFNSETEGYRRIYEQKSTVVLVVRGKIIGNPYDKKVRKATLLELKEETWTGLRDNSDDPRVFPRYQCFSYFCNGSTKTYQVQDATLANGTWENRPYSEIYPTFEAYLDAVHADDWNEDAKDYGYYRTDFTDEDYHTPSWLTLREMLDADYSAYTARKYKLDRSVYDEIVKHGKMPEKFTVEESAIGDLRDVFMEALSPTVTLSWQPDEIDRSKYALFCGVDQLQDIANKYEVEPDDIRIIFAFDN